MSWKNKLSDAMRQQEIEIAREAVLQALRSNTAGEQPIRALLSELEEDPRLWGAFETLTLKELRETLVPTPAPGPDRRRGITSDRIITFVRDNNGCSLGRIAKTLGLGRGAVTSQLRKLRAEGRLHVEGRERRYKYFVR
jgi:hypothetical protein